MKQRAKKRFVASKGHVSKPGKGLLDRMVRWTMRRRGRKVVGKTSDDHPLSSPVSLDELIGLELFLWRKENAISREQLARVLGKSSSSVLRMEYGLSKLSVFDLVVIRDSYRWKHRTSVKPVSVIDEITASIDTVLGFDKLLIGNRVRESITRRLENSLG